MTLNYLKRIVLSDATHMMSMADFIDISVETPRIDSECYLEKELPLLIHMNPRIILYLIVNQVDSYHDCVCGPLIGDTKDIVWIDDLLLIMTY